MNRNRRFGGTTLVITLALLAALAIIGTTMISMARMDRFAARSYRYNTQMDLAADASLEWFGARWAEEYWNRAVPYYPNAGTATTAKPMSPVQPSAWNSYDVCLPGDAVLSSRGDSPYDGDSLITPLGTTGTSPLNVSPLSRTTGGAGLDSWSNLCYTLTNLVKNEPQVTNVPAAAWPISNPGAEGSYVYPELRFPAGPNRTIEVSLTAVDLDARLNFNFTGSYDKNIALNSAYSNAICTNWRGDSIQQVIPPPPSTIVRVGDLENIIAGYAPASGGSGVGRYGITTPNNAAATSELVDGMMNPFAPGIYYNLAGTAPGVALPATHPLPYSLEDLAELLNISGPTAATGLGTFNSRLVTQASLASLGTPGAYTALQKLYRSMYTTHSWTSAARRYYTKLPTTLPAALPNEPVDSLHVKADLNNAPQLDLEQALLATRMFNPSTPLDMNVMEQIVANIMDYRRECNPNPSGHAGSGASRGHPTAISGTTPANINLGATKIFGVQRQPYINEVYMIRNTANNGIDPNNKSNYIYSVYVELANPYDQPLVNGVSYTKLTLGTLGTQNITPVGPIPYASGPGLAGGYVVGTVISTPSNLPQTEVSVGQYLEPICLYTTATDGTQLLIDRMQHCWPADPTQKVTQLSMQRPTYNVTGAQPPAIGTAYNHAGAAQNFFGGYMEGPGYDLWAAVQMTNAGGTLLAANLAGTAGTYKPTLPPPTTSPNKAYPVRPIENRSRTWYKDANTPVRTRACFQPWLANGTVSSTIPDLSFASPGDLCRLLIIGPQPNGSFGYVAGTLTMSPSTVTEQLGALPPATPATDTECDFHIDIAKISTKTSPASNASPTAYGLGGTPYDWRRLLDVFNVNSPYYDGLDNSGRGLVVDNQFTPAAAAQTGSAAALVGELYEHGRINLLTAPPQVIQGLMAPFAYIAPAVGDTTIAAPTTLTTYLNRIGGVKTSPADILDLSNKWGQGLFCNNGGAGCSVKHCDDDGNGAFDDYAKRCWLYTFISNWATIRSDCVAVYGTVRLMDTTVSTTQPQGLRHFVAVMDRVPATAFQPLLYNSAAVPVKPNPNYQPPRRLLLTWLD